MGKSFKIAVVSGSRAEFGLLERSLATLRNAPWCDLKLLVAGMHLVPQLGFTVRDVEAHFEIAARIQMHPPEDSCRGMALSVARGMSEFTNVLSRLQPQLLLLLGDRTEPFAAALACAYLGIPIAHVHGGDSSGNAIDDFQRHAISRLACIHLAATEQSASTLRALGVEGTVRVVGAPGLDAIVGRQVRPKEELARSLGLPLCPWLVVLQHPNPVESDAAEPQMKTLLEAAQQVAAENGALLVILYPNNDAGHGGMLAAIEDFPPHTRSRSFASLPRAEYLDLLSHALLRVGNSSSAMIESASIGIPVVNIGNRQEGRERDANVVDSSFQVEEIVAACRQALTDPKIQAALHSRSSIYGDGRASMRIVQALEEFSRSTAVGVTEDITS